MFYAWGFPLTFFDPWDSENHLLPKFYLFSFDGVCMLKTCDLLFNNMTKVNF